MLTDLYAQLCQTIPKGEESLVGLPVSAVCPIWLSVDRQTHPALLFPAHEVDVRADIILRAVEVIFSRACEIESAGGRLHKGCYSIIRLKDNDADVVRLFLKIVEDRFLRGQAQTDNAGLAANIQEIAALFSRINSGRCNLVGLWGELYVIDQAEDVDAAVRCWSVRKTAKYDFVTERFVLDVKTTMSATPRHRFSHEQLRPKGSIDAYIASLRVVEVRVGRTVGTLMDGIAAKLSDPELRAAFLRQCLTKGGSDLYRSDLTLQTYPDNGALTIYQAQEIPVPEIAKTDPIENVRFDVVLSSITALEYDTCGTILRFQE